MRSNSTTLPRASSSNADIAAGFTAVAEQVSIRWTLSDCRTRLRVMILVSKFDHCLVDLLYRWRIGEFEMDAVGIVANHPRETCPKIDIGNSPFHYLPVTRQREMELETRIWELVRDSRTELVVLARYVQVLSDGLVGKLARRCVNIHHSFLTGFNGAKPSHQAHERGVKLIGATVHLVTSDLDERPIVEQDVERVSHRDTPDDLVRKGRDIERRVLADGVRFLLENRVIQNGHKTVVFR
jgi:formyltetrahydrofolate deformylase